jgi:hypothetical protein
MRTSYDSAYHGLKEKNPSGQTSIVALTMKAFPSSATSLNAFDDFCAFLGHQHITAETTIHIAHLLPQVLIGHRLWMSASGTLERFVPLKQIRIMHNENDHHIWLKLGFSRGDLTRCTDTVAKLLNGTRLSDTFELVKTDKDDGDDWAVEQKTADRYTGYPSDILQDTVNRLKPFIWQSVISVPPYRKYYLYLSPAGEANSVLPQLASIYATAYFLSSVTRYRPSTFSALAKGPYGPFIETFLQDQLNQFLYILASEITQTEFAFGEQI